MFISLCNLQDGARGFNVPDVYVDRRLDGSGNIDHLYELDEQNKKLRLVIRQMREDMESMNQLRREDSSLAIAKPPESTDSVFAIDSCRHVCVVIQSYVW